MIKPCGVHEGREAAVRADVNQGPATHGGMRTAVRFFYPSVFPALREIPPHPHPTTFSLPPIQQTRAHPPPFHCRPSSRRGRTPHPSPAVHPADEGAPPTLPQLHIQQTRARPLPHLSLTARPILSSAHLLWMESSSRLIRRPMSDEDGALCMSTKLRSTTGRMTAAWPLAAA